MLKHALEHDRMVLGRFLDKKYDSILRYELGDIQNRLDWDPTNIRCYLVEYFDNGFMVLVTLAFLLFQALRLSPVYTLIVFALSLLKLAVPLAVRKTEGKYEKERIGTDPGQAVSGSRQGLRERHPFSGHQL